LSTGNFVLQGIARGLEMDGRFLFREAMKRVLLIMKG